MMSPQMRSTLRRWRRAGSEVVAVDQRPLADRPAPAHKLTTAEQQAVMDVCQRSEFSSLPPSQIVPKLADRGSDVMRKSGDRLGRDQLVLTIDGVNGTF